MHHHAIFTNQSEALLTHVPTIEKPTMEDITGKLLEIKNRISTDPETKENAQALVNLAEELAEFELGRFLMKNEGALSGYWTYYVIVGHNIKRITNPLEKYLLTRAPIVLATRQRFYLFQEYLKKNIQSNSVVCSIPCGLMADLLTLKIDNDIKNVQFVGIDLDETVFLMAKELAKHSSADCSCDFIKKDAFELGHSNKYDVLTSNGLNIYENNDDKVVELYRNFFSALKPGGTLITSVLTVPPGQSKASEWDMDKINKADMEKQLAVFSYILRARWANFRTTDETISQLQKAGFKNVQLVWDEQRIFPTFVGEKPSASQRRYIDSNI